MKFTMSMLLSLLMFSICIPIHIDADSVPKVIETYEEDITGDGSKEVITLKGTLLSEESTFYQNIWAEIENKYSEWTISYGGGYNPKIDFIDLEHDQTRNLLYSSQSEDNDFSNYHLHSLKNDNMKKLSLPKQDYTNGKFQDKFTISITISPDGQTETVKVDPKSYISKGIYTNDGSLAKPISVKVTQPILKKHYLSKQQGYGIKSFQTFQDPVKQQKIGTIETLWYFENDKWIILNHQWMTET